MNNISLTGRLTADPEIKKTQSDKSVCSVNIAVDRDYKVNGERVTDFVPCVFWRSTAEFVGKYFKKGDMIAVVGSLESRKYEKDGKTFVWWEVKADKVNFCGNKKAEEPTFNQVQADVDDDMLPF